MKYQVIHEFNGRDGEIPFGVLFQGADGALYGTTNCGGFYDRGVVYKLNLDGSGFRVLHNFSRVLGSYPESGVIQGAGGVLYGTTTQGGSYNRGVVYALKPDGFGYRVLHSFAGGKEGGYPEACVIQAADGALYGTTRLGGAYGRGTVFRLNTDGSGFQILHSFEGDDGAYPLHGVMQGSDGALYGTTRSGGHYEIGVVYKMNLDGSGFCVLHSFIIEQGAHPWPSVIEASDGALYGTTKYGGDYDMGTVFRMETDRTNFMVVRRFTTSAKKLPQIWNI